MLIIFGILFLARLDAGAGEVGFTSKPSVQKKDGLATVSFAVNRSTDVAVYVLNAKDKCVRHVAAGVLGGKNPPPAPLKPGLAQKLEWDGKDDYGEAATGGPFKVRVALGLDPEFGGFLLHHRAALPRVSRLAVGPKGELYCFYLDPASLEQNNGGFKIRVRSREGKPISVKTPGWSGLMNFQQNYMDVSVKDEIYVVPGSNGKMKWTAGGAGNLTVFGMDLLPKRVAVSGVSIGCIPRLDLAGNIYLAENVRPLEGNYPKFFAGKLKSGKSAGFPKQERAADWPYTYMYGSIVKFPPEGGKILAKAPKDAKDKGLLPFRYPMRFQRNRRGALKGAEWVRFGFSPYSNISIGGGSQNCMCEGSGFGVDGFGRVFYPNLGRFRVEMIDTNNNFIGTFGKYGNMDSGGPDAIVKTPDIPLAWPTYVAVGDSYAFVSDVASTRIVKVKLNYAVEAVCPAAGGPASITRAGL